MTIENAKLTITHIAVLGETTFAYDFLVLAKKDMYIYIGGVPYLAGFDITGLGDNAGGTIILDIAITAEQAGKDVYIVRVVDFDQLIDYTAYDAFPAESHERSLDKLTMMVQQNGFALTRAIAIPLTEDPLLFQTTLPLSGERANREVSFDSLGNVVMVQSERRLDNPSVNGYVLASTTGGVRFWTENIGTGTDNHDDLNNRNLANQHAISSITDLQSTLNSKSDVGHDHNIDYFQKTEHLNSSSGAGDSGKPVVLNSQGQIDPTMVDFAGLTPQGDFTPEAGAEYPLNPEVGYYWSVTGVGTGYTFLTGDLIGQTALNGNVMMFSANGWSLLQSGIDPNLYYHLDGSVSITAPFAGGNQQIKTIDHGTDSNDAVTVTQLATKEDADPLIQAHLSDISNPHLVTKEQVGLSEVDNTSDADKPTSTATNNALALKSDTTHLHAQYIESVLESGVGTVLNNMLRVTQSEYDALTPVSTTVYFIVG